MCYCKGGNGDRKFGWDILRIFINEFLLVGRVIGSCKEGWGCMGGIG